MLIDDIFSKTGRLGGIVPALVLAAAFSVMQPPQQPDGLIGVALADDSGGNKRPLTDIDICEDPYDDAEAAVTACSHLIDRLRARNPYCCLAAHLRRSEAYVELDDLDHAAADLDAAERLAPDLPRIGRARIDLFNEMGEPAKVIGVADAALKKSPEDTELLTLRAMAYADSGKYDAALADLSKTLALQSAPEEQAGTLALRGYVYQISRQITPAIADYDKALSLSPKQMTALMGRADIDLMQRNYEMAIVRYGWALVLDPTYLEALLGRGTAYIYGGNVQQGMRDIDAVLAKQPKNAAAHLTRSVALTLDGQFDAALKENRKAIDLAPRATGYHSYMANIYLRMGAYDKATAEAKRAVAGEMPGYGHLMLSALGLLQGQESAIAQAKEALALHQDDLRAYQSLIVADYMFGDYKAAVEAADQALKIKADDGLVWAERGSAHVLAGDRQAAIDDFAKANSFGRKDGETQMLLCLNEALIETPVGTPAETPAAATSHCALALSLMPNYPEALAARAYAKMRQADWAGAKAELDLADHFSRRNPLILFNRAYVEERLEQNEQAAADYTTARSINPLVDVWQKRMGIIPGIAALGTIE